MIKLTELKSEKEVKKFWSILLKFMQYTNRIDPSPVDSALKDLKKKSPTVGRQIGEKYEAVEKALSTYKKELQKFNTYVIGKKE